MSFFVFFLNREKMSRSKNPLLFCNFSFFLKSQAQFFSKSRIRAYYYCLLWVLSIYKIILLISKNFEILCLEKSVIQFNILSPWNIHANVYQNVGPRFCSNWTHINYSWTGCLYYKTEKIVWRFFKFSSFKRSFIFFFGYIQCNINHSKINTLSFLITIHQKKFTKHNRFSGYLRLLFPYFHYRFYPNRLHCTSIQLLIHSSNFQLYIFYFDIWLFDKFIQVFFLIILDIWRLKVCYYLA